MVMRCLILGELKVLIGLSTVTVEACISLKAEYLIQERIDAVIFK